MRTPRYEAAEVAVWCTKCWRANLRSRSDGFSACAAASVLSAALWRPCLLLNPLTSRCKLPAWLTARDPQKAFWHKLLAQCLQAAENLVWKEGDHKEAQMHSNYWMLERVDRYLASPPNRAIVK